MGAADLAEARTKAQAAERRGKIGIVSPKFKMCSHPEVETLLFLGYFLYHSGQVMFLLSAQIPHLLELR